MTFATWQDLADRWRPLSVSEQTLAMTLLADASDMVREQFPDADERLAAGALMQSTLVRITVGMVKRAMSNMEGKRQESIDDYSWTLDREVSSGYLFLSEGDRAALGPSRVRRRAFAVDLGQ